MLYYWMCQNIIYDTEGYFSGVYKVGPEETYNNGKSVCSGYSRLFEYLGTYIGLDIKCVSGYAKGYGYQHGEKISGTNHEWNIIKLKNVLYPIDSTWGAGYLKDKQFKKVFREFYFCTDTYEFIFSHFPEEDKWQLIYPTVTIEEFSKFANFKEKMFKFFITEAIYHTLQVKGMIVIPFLHMNKKDNIEVLVDIYDKEENETKDALNTIIYGAEMILLLFIFKKIGTYKADIYADYRNIESKSFLVSYYFENEEEFEETPETPFSLPKIYNNDITIIEPIFNIMKKGEKVRIRMHSVVTDEIIITNDKWLYIKKNERDFFEATITVNTDEIFIGRKTDEKDFLTSIIYEVN